MKKLLPLLAMIPMMATPAMAGLASEFEAQNEGGSIRQQCEQIVDQLYSTGTVPLHAYTKRNTFNDGTYEITFKIVKGNKVYTGATVNTFLPRRPTSITYSGPCIIAGREEGTLGKEQVDYRVACHGLGCSDYTVKRLWTFEGDKLVFYYQHGNSAVTRTQYK
jgi:hypothetical protein